MSCGFLTTIDFLTSAGTADEGDEVTEEGDKVTE